MRRTSREDGAELELALFPVGGPMASDDQEKGAIC
jgi:hypothetical protein